MLNTVICDDETPALELLTEMLEDTGEVRIAAACQSVSQALTRVAQGGIDLLVLDIEMPGLTGVEAARSISVEPKPLLVFATAHPEYAADAFGIDAIDYLLKPFDVARVRHAVDKARRLHSLIRQAGEHGDGAGEALSPVADANTLRLQDGARHHVVPLAEIIWIEAAGDYSLIHRTNADLAVRRKISSLENDLPTDRFRRIHRSAIIALDHIREVRRLAKGEAEFRLSSGGLVRSSRGYKDAVASLLTG